MNIINIPNNYYIMFDDGLNYKLVPTDGKITQILSNGKWTIKIYSDKCDNVIDTITFRLPKFNIYFLDPLCKNIDGEIYKLFKGVIYTVWNEANIMELTYKYPENQTSIMNLAKTKNCLPCPSGVHLKMEGIPDNE